MNSHRGHVVSSPSFQSASLTSSPHMAMSLSQQTRWLASLSTGVSGGASSTWSEGIFLQYHSTRLRNMNQVRTFRARDTRTISAIQFTGSNQTDLGDFVRKNSNKDAVILEGADGTAVLYTPDDVPRRVEPWFWLHSSPGGRVIVSSNAAFCAGWEEVQ